MTNVRHGMESDESNWVSFLQHCSIAHAEENFMEKNPKQWRLVFPPSENNKLHPHLSFSELLLNPCTRTEETALQEGHRTSKWKHFQGSSPHPCPFQAYQITDRLARFFPHQYSLLSPQMVQLSSVQGHPIFFHCDRGENETFLGAKISPVTRQQGPCCCLGLLSFILPTSEKDNARCWPWALPLAQLTV